MARNCKNTRQVWIDIKYFFTWLTGMKKLIFYVNNFFGSGHFFNPWYLKKDQKMAGTKFFLYPKISSVMPVNHANEFLKYVLYFHTFLQELQMAPSIPILEINVPNLVQGLLRTCYLLIWVWQLDFRETKLHYYI